MAETKRFTTADFSPEDQALYVKGVVKKQMGIRLGAAIDDAKIDGFVKKLKPEQFAALHDAGRNGESVEVAAIIATL